MPGLLDALLCRKDAAGLRDAGLRRKLLAGRARELGFRAPAASIAAAEQAWLGSLGVRARDRDAFLAASGLDEVEARRLCEDVALERLVLDHAARWLNDGPSVDEAIADEARLRGHWAAAARGGHSVQRVQNDGPAAEDSVAGTGRSVRPSARRSRRPRR